VLYRGFQIHSREITIENSLSPLNLTIIISASTYLPYMNMTTEASSTITSTSKNSSSNIFLNLKILSSLIFLFIYFILMKEN
ncbi:unnamed protein product, partial [Rotaria sp. Silwood2]